MKYVFLSLFILLFACNSPVKKDNVIKESTTNKEVSGDNIRISPERIDPGQLPPEIRFKGKLSEAWQWKDKLGENILITTFVAPYYVKEHKAGDNNQSVNEDGRTGELYAFHFIKKDTGYKLLWLISDAERNCPFDVTNEFIKEATTITDLDEDGIAETTVQYRICCRSDVSPSGKKLIMYEDTVKYALRGMMCDIANPPSGDCVTEKDVNLEKQPPAKEEWEEYTRLFGRYETEKEFANAPPAFLEHARREWLKFNKESFE